MAAPPATLAVEARGLVRSFGARRAADGLDLEVRVGELFALLGPNGAGKSTAIDILATRLLPDAGTARVAGFDCVAQPAAVRARLGLVFQERTLDPHLTAAENLRAHATLHGLPGPEARRRAAAALERAGLAARARDFAGTLSPGLARRLELARAMLAAPEVLILDEPTAGLDPRSRAAIWADVAELRRAAGTTVLFTTHDLAEAMQADRVAVLDRGRVLATAPPAELQRRHGTLDAAFLAMTGGGAA